MKKLLIASMSLFVTTATSANAAACMSWMDANKGFYDDRTTEQLANAKLIDDTLDNYGATGEPSHINPNKKVILIGLDGISFENQAEEVYGGLDYQGLDSANSHVYNSGIFPIQNYESQAGWDAIYYGNVLGPKLENYNIFDMVSEDKGHIIAEMNPWVDTSFLTPRGTSFPSLEPEVWWSDAENGRCESYLTESGATDKINDSLDLMSQMFFNDRDHKKTWSDFINATQTDIERSWGGGYPGDTTSYNMINIFNEISDVCGHSHFGYDTPVLNAIEVGYNKMFNKIFDSSFLDPENYLILSVTDHGRNADGLDHYNGDPNSHESFIISNHDLDEVMQLGGSNQSFKNLYDIRTMVWNWINQA